MQADYNEKTIYIDMKPAHRSIYESVVICDLGIQRSVRDTVNRFPYMMLACDDPSLLKKHSDKLDPQLNRMIDNFKDSSLEVVDSVEFLNSK